MRLPPQPMSAWCEKGGAVVSAPARQENPGRSRRPWSRARRFDRPMDGARLLAAVNAAGQRRDRTATLTRAVDRARDVVMSQPDGARIVPVAPELAGLLPWPGGVRGGTTVAAVGSTSLLFALIADGVANGAWAAVVGMPGLGVAAAAEYGCDLTIQLVERRWRGLAQGRGRLRVQEVTLSAAGRGRADRLRWTSTTMPPPSIAGRVGPLPGQVPGLPVHLRPVDPPPAADRALPRRPRPVPACPPEPWREMFRQGQPAGTP